MALRDIKLRNKIMISTGLVVLISFIIVILLVAKKSEAMARTSAFEIADRTANQYANQVTNELDGIMDTMTAMASAFEGMKESNQVDRSTMNSMITNLLKNHQEYLATWTLWEPNALDGKDAEYANQPGYDASGRFIPYWNRGSGEIKLEPLVDYETPGAGDYYLIPKNTKQETIIEPYAYPIDGKNVLITSIVVPIISEDNNMLIGVVGTDIALESIQKMMAEIKPLNTGFATLISHEGKYVANPDIARLGQEVEDNHAKEAIKAGKGYKSVTDDFYKVYVPINVGKATTPWSLEISVPMSTVLEQANSIRNFSIVVALIALVVIGLVIFWVSNTITKPIVQTSRVLKDISEGDGDLTQRLKGLGKSEIGELADYFNRFIEDIHKIIKEVTATAGSLGATSEELSAAAEEATASSEHVASTLAQLAAGANEQAVSVGKTGGVIELLAVNAQQVAENAESVSQSSGKAARAAEIGAHQAENAVNKIQHVREASEQTAEVVFQLGDQSKEIGQIVDVIKGIAEQTNLLALNAAIEAARAGEHGRGFAVVAEEVRKLAEQSSSSAAQIETLIGTIQRDTEKAVAVIEKGKVEVVAGVEAVNLAGHSFQTIVNEINVVVEQIQQVSSATQQMAQGIAEAVHSVEGIGVIAEESAASTQEVSSASEEQAATMASVSQSAEALAELGISLTRLVGKFKA